MMNDANEWDGYVEVDVTFGAIEKVTVDVEDCQEWPSIDLFKV